jgi:hypothetical protein
LSVAHAPGVPRSQGCERLCAGTEGRLQSFRSFARCPTESGDQRLRLLETPVQGRLLIGPQVTNLPHKSSQYKNYE